MLWRGIAFQFIAMMSLQPCDRGLPCCCSACAFDWPVNLAVASPSEGSAPGALVAVVGDDPEAFIVDLRTRGHVHRLKGHLDYSFAAAWHPSDSHTVATGNQVSLPAADTIHQLQSCTLLESLHARMHAAQELTMRSSTMHLQILDGKES